MSCLLQPCFPCPPIGCLNSCLPCPPCPSPCFNPCLPCISPCFPCWPCKPCPCPPPEKLGIPQTFPDIPKKKKKKRKKKKESIEKATSATAVEVEDIAIGNPCRCCKRCMCMGPKPDQPCYVGGECCRACPCSGCAGCKPCPPPCPPPACTCKPPPKMCTCSNTRSKLTTSSGKICGCGNTNNDMVCGESCKAASKNTEMVRCEVCGHRKRASVSSNKESTVRGTAMPVSTFDDATLSGLRKGPVPNACCRSTDILESRFKPPEPRNTVKTCSGCGKKKRTGPKLCSGCKSLGL